MHVVRVLADDAASSAAVAELVAELRAVADGFVFLAGGASKMRDEVKSRLLALFDAFDLLVGRGVRFAVGDGGTKAGLMEASGLARRASGDRFPLVGVSPAPEITLTGESGKTPIDPNHSHLVVVDNPAWERVEDSTPGGGYWGSETEAMHAIFGRLSEGRPSVALVANGGAITLREVRLHLSARRPVVVVAGSGRAADAVLAAVTGAAVIGTRTWPHSNLRSRP